MAGERRLQALLSLKTLRTIDCSMLDFIAHDEWWDRSACLLLVQSVPALQRLSLFLMMCTQTKRTDTLDYPIVKRFMNVPHFR
jgi:hypothetical protein